MRLLKYSWIFFIFSVNAEVSVPNTFSNGQLADADEVNANFTALANGINTRPNLRLIDDTQTLGSVLEFDPSFSETYISVINANNYIMDFYFDDGVMILVGPDIDYEVYYLDDACTGTPYYEDKAGLFKVGRVFAFMDSVFYTDANAEPSIVPADQVYSINYQGVCGLHTTYLNPFHLVPIRLPNNPTITGFSGVIGDNVRLEQ